MTKAEIVQAVYSRLGGFSKKESADLVDLVFETMKETLARGEKIKVSGFGNFVLRDKRSRPGRNPQTGDPIVITERRVLSFKPSQILKQVLNSDRPASMPPGGQSAGGQSADGYSAGAGTHGAGSHGAGSHGAGSQGAEGSEHSSGEANGDGAASGTRARPAEAPGMAAAAASPVASFASGPNRPLK